MTNDGDTFVSAAVQSLADELLAALAAQFPVCCASDEFHYFPQAAVPDAVRFQWDDFGPEALSQCVRQMAAYQGRLSRLEKQSADLQVRIDIAMLQRLITTLTEQLTDVRVHETQPSYYLTIAAIGLAEAFEAGRPAWEARIRSLPPFLRQATRNLQQVPGLFRDIGCEMAEKLGTWLAGLQASGLNTAPAIEALAQMTRDLKRLPTRDPFTLEASLYARVARTHIGCRLDVTEIDQLLETEVADTRDILQAEAPRFSSARTWQAALQQISRPVTGADGAGPVYQAVIAELETHCRRQEIVSPAQISACPVTVRPIPEYLRPIRSSAAYSMPPGHPPSGGTFYTMPAGSREALSSDYRLLTAHETYPGHHLLDMCRWGHARPLRRHIEFPLFYEGWASFSEELLFDTGFFSGPVDRFLMAKRRFWRAVRGQIDLDLHTGKKDLRQAASHLTRTGMPRSRADAMVRRYALKPAYQLCYTVGRCGFRSLYDQFCRQGRPPREFAVRVLNAGQIGLDPLKRTLLQP